MPYEEGRVRVTKAVAGALGRGCRLSGGVRVRKVAGSLHVSAPRTLANMDGRLAFTVPPETMAGYNASHTIHTLSFGPAFPGQVAPLDGVTSPVLTLSGSDTPTTGAFQYHIKVVPTLYEYLYGTLVDSQQYSVSDFAQAFEPPGENGVGGVFVHPGVWWKFDFSPIMVRRVESRRSLAQFLVSLCAILGGVYALSGVIDQVVHRAVESRKAK
jgi:hypothetical protein